MISISAAAGNGWGRDGDEESQLTAWSSLHPEAISGHMEYMDRSDRDGMTSCWVDGEHVEMMDVMSWRWISSLFLIEIEFHSLRVRRRIEAVV